MRTTSSYRRSWPGRRLAKAALETPEPAMRQKLCDGSSRRRLVLPHRSRVPCRPPRWPRSSPARALVRSWAPGQQVHGESPRLVGWVDYRTCVRVHGAGPPVVPVAAVPSTPAAWTRCWTGCSRWRWPAYRTPPWPPTWWGCGSRSPDWSRSSPARLVVFDRRGAAGVTGAVSTAAWLRQACRLSPGEAGERVRTARVLADDLPVTADALAAGDLSYAHARVLAAAAPELPADPLG